jgi:NADH-quinone oxidoreductase subunit C
VLVSTLKCLKLSSFFSFKILSDITAIDQLEKEYRFRLDYNLVSNSKRLMVTTFIKELEFCNSVTKVFSSANWLEREVWDLYGVYFLNHGDLRRILTDYGFRGYPFRKDFPLTGYIELRFDDSRGDVVYEPVELMQELRFFNFATGWEVD